MFTSKTLTSQHRQLSPTVSYWFILKFIFLTPLVHTHLKLFGYNRTLALLNWSIPRNLTRTAPPNDIKTFSDHIRYLIRHMRNHSPLPGSCLSRSLTLWWQLRLSGIKTELYIGTRNYSSCDDSPTFQAHAWVEYLGYPLNAGKEVRQRYVAFDQAISSESIQK